MPQTYLKKSVVCVILLVSLASTGLFTTLFAQENKDVIGVEEKGILYNRISNTGITLHSRGIGINYRYGKNLTGYSFLMGDFHLLTMRHPKEIKSINPFSDNNSGFIYGKLNTMTILRTGIGKQKTMNAKGDKGGVELSYGYFGGASWAFLKPVYLNIFEFSDDLGVTEVVEQYNPNTHYPDNISGRASMLKGLNEINIRPGLYANFLLNIEFHKEPSILRIIEAGVSADIYPQPIEIMAFSEKSNFFFTFFVRYMVGKKWNK